MTFLASAGAGAVVAALVSMHIADGSVNSVRANEAQNRMASLTAEMSDLRKEIRVLSKTVAHYTSGTSTSQVDTKSHVDSHIDLKVDRLESALGDIQRQLEGRTEKYISVLSPDYADSPLQVSSDALARSTELGERAYQADTSDINRAREEQVISAFEAHATLADLRSVSCKSNVCKIGYSATQVNDQTVANSASQHQFVDELASVIGLKNYRVHHGVDESGGRVVYIRADYR